VSVTNSDDKDKGPTWTLKMILPSGVRHAVNALDAGDIIRTEFGEGVEYRTLVRAYAKKFPGFHMSDFKAILLATKAIVSIPQYK